MSDLIDRQAAIDAMANTLWHYPNECYRNLNEYEISKGLAELGLRSVPTVEPKKGKWISEKNKSYSGGGCWRCSNCGYGYAWDAFFEVDSFNYCPNCGARMEGKDE